MTLLFATTTASYYILLQPAGSKYAEIVAILPRNRHGQAAAELIIDALSRVNNWPVEVI
jgi:hypothetical protein